MFGLYNDPQRLVVPTRETVFSGTYAIAVAFVFLAYFLQPVVEKAYQRVRAYRGWRAIEKSETVEVTTYPLVSEILGVRGRWDAARVVAMLLAVFSLASWGLELQMDLAHIEGSVTDLFLRPPPVWKNKDGDAWYVIRLDEFSIDEYDVPNMDKNASAGIAKARYKVNKETDVINGKVRIASWDIDVEKAECKLFYNDDGRGIGNVTSHECISNEKPVNLYVEADDEPWGTIIDCRNGPQRVSGEKNSTSHVVKLASNTGDVYFIVEESSTYPSFLYSVWKARKDEVGTTLHHVFHIFSSVRLAEAVVTEIVDADKKERDPTGGRSFALLRMFSENNASYNVDMEDRASPFGEHPTGETPEDVSLSTIESIEKGIQLNTTALLCAVWLMFLALVGIAWSFLLRSSIEMDIYDRDELIKAVTLVGSANGAEHSSKMRIFVKREENGKLSVVVSEAEFHPRDCVQRCRKKQGVTAIDEPMPKTPSRDPRTPRGNVGPIGTQMLWLEGVRMGKGRAYPGRRGNYRYPTSVALVASPVLSPVGSIAGTPVHRLNSPADESLRTRRFPGANSALFDSVRALDSCNESGGDSEMDISGRTVEPKARLGNETNSPGPCRSESRETEVPDLRGLRVIYQSTCTLHSRSPSSGHTTGSTLKTPERLGSLSPNSGEETKDNTNRYNHAEVTESK